MTHNEKQETGLQIDRDTGNVHMWRNLMSSLVNDSLENQFESDVIKAK